MAEIVMVKARYYSFGRALGLPAGELEAVRLANNQNPEQGLNDVTLAWLQQKYNIVKHGPPTWRRLVEAVDDAAGGDNHKLARTIGSQHPIGICMCTYQEYNDNTYMHHVVYSYTTTVP